MKFCHINALMYTSIIEKKNIAFSEFWWFLLHFQAFFSFKCLKNKVEKNFLDFKGTVSVHSSDPQCKDGNARFRTVPFKAF